MAPNIQKSLNERRIWKPLNRPEFGLSDSISSVIGQGEWQNPDLLTSVRLGPTLIITSDYGGNYKGSHYESISFLIADLTFCWLWDEFRQKIRKDILRDSRRISYKKLNEQRRAKALVPFLRASNTIPGLLITIIIDKQIVTLFSEDTPSDDTSSVVKLGEWNKKSFCRLSRIGHLGAMLVSCMSAPHQNLIWITDEDEIAPNVEKLREATDLIGHYLNHYCDQNIGHFRFGTTRSDDGSMGIEDLAALPDLAAGCLSEVLTAAFKDKGMPLGQIHLPLPRGITKKARLILSWISETSHPLRKLSVCVDKAENNTYRVKLLSTILEEPISVFD